VRDLIETCAPAKEDPMMTAAINYCHGFVQGAVLVEEAHEAQPCPRRLFCLPSPPPPSGSELSKFIAWANVLPSRLDEPAIDGMFIYLSETYPCAQEAAGGLAGGLIFDKVKKTKPRLAGGYNRGVDEPRGRRPGTGRDPTPIAAGLAAVAWCRPGSPSCRDLVLQRENVGEIAVVALGPDVLAALGFVSVEYISDDSPNDRVVGAIKSARAPAKDAHAPRRAASSWAANRSGEHTIGFAVDSPLEGAGFEPSVPRDRDDGFRSNISRSPRKSASTTENGFAVPTSSAP
jgi:hypothetical protein